MDKIFLPSHKDSGNRGCEAITRGTAKIVGLDKSRIIALSNDFELDERLNLDKVVTLNRFESKKINLFLRVKRKLLRNTQQKNIFDLGYHYEDFMNKISKNDIALSTGGDMFCYTNNEVIYINDWLTKKHRKTVLWGCSIGEENLSPEKISTLKKFSLITARESLTKEMLEEKLGLKTVKLFPDPAFVLEPEKIELPEYWNDNSFVGLNLSNFVGSNVGFDTIFGKNVLNLINYIIDKTSFSILLIPHVFWFNQDDRDVCKMVYDYFKNTGRVKLFDSEKYNYCQIRYIISKCSFFMGARTHAMISAYSTEVPAAALGYSVKSRGIAKDLGMPKETVVDCKNLSDENQLVNAFKYLEDNKEKIMAAYKNTMNGYKKLAFKAKEALEKI